MYMMLEFKGKIHPQTKKKNLFRRRVNIKLTF